MTTRTELATRALAHIGEQGIADIDDAEQKQARVCKEFAQQVIDETLRAHRWNCAIARATLSELSEAPNHGFDHAYQLPSDFIRLLEVNGEQWQGSSEFHEIEAEQRLLTDEESADIRYIQRIDVPAMDPLLKKVVALALAVEIALPLTQNANLREALEGALARAMAKAMKVDAIETGSRENRPLQRLLENSPLRLSRYYGARCREREITITSEPTQSGIPDLDTIFEEALD